MGFYEKALGLVIVPFLFVLLVLLATGIFRRQVNWLVRLLLKFNFRINERTIYFFPMVCVLNLFSILWGYLELCEMTEPDEMAAKAQYFERLYRTYRNFLINILSVVLIFQIFNTGRNYQKYAVIRDEVDRRVRAR